MKQPPETTHITRDPVQIVKNSIKFLRQLREQLVAKKRVPYFAARITPENAFEIISNGFTGTNYLSLSYDLARLGRDASVADLANPCCELHRLAFLRQLATAEAMMRLVEDLAGCAAPKGN